MKKQKYRILLFLLISVAFFNVSAVHAEEESTHLALSQKTVDRGYTVSFYDGQFRLAIPAGVLATPTTVDIFGPLDAAQFPPPGGFRFVSDQYQFSISQESPRLLHKPVRISIRTIGEGLWKRSIVFYNGRTGTWQLIPSRTESGRVSAWIRFPYVRVAVVEEQGVLASLGLRSRAAAVFDGESETVVGAFHDDVVLPIASLSKLMTAIVFVETDPDWSAVLTYAKSDDRIGAKLRMASGEQLSVQDAFAAMLIGSANNATMALVRSTGLGEEAFVRRMNEKAQELGLLSTSFAEPTGLSDKNVSTAAEYARVAQAAFDVPEIEEMAQKHSYAFLTLNTKRRHVLQTTNDLLKRNIGIIAGKTGYTDEAGYCLAVKSQTTLTHRPFLVVVLGNATSAGRFREAARLSEVAARSL